MDKESRHISHQNKVPRNFLNLNLGNDQPKVLELVKFTDQSAFSSFDLFFHKISISVTKIKDMPLA